MLVLTRKLQEEIVIDGEITLTVLQIKGNRIRLGIKAPRSTSIRRAELEELPETKSIDPAKPVAC